MAEITRQRVGELLQALFTVLKENPEGLPAREALEQVEQRIQLTPFEESTYPNNPEVRRFEKIVRFSTISPVKAGWMVKDKGQWTITEPGIEALETYSDPEELAREAQRRYRQWKRGQEELAVEEEESDTASAMATLEEAEETA